MWWWIHLIAVLLGILAGPYAGASVSLGLLGLQFRSVPVVSKNTGKHTRNGTNGNGKSGFESW
jgi:hypothetical protein